MVEGFDNDDRWRMVEDEFYSVAARFTAHLHAAQYRRLKDEAKKQNPTIHTLARPVTRPPTLDVVRRQAASTLVASQRRAIATAKLHSKASSSASTAAPAAAAQPGDEDSDRFQIRTPRKRTHLASLLDSPRKKAQPLSIATSNGKASAAAINTSSQPSSLGIRTGTPSAQAMSFATHHKISMSTAKTAHARYGPHDIPERAAVGVGLTPGLARSQSDHNSNVDDLERNSARSNGILQANHLTAEASKKTVIERDVSARDGAPQKPMSADHASRTPTPQSAEVNDGSDSGSETYFQRRLRARRSKPRPQRGHRPATPDEPSGKEASQARPKSQDTSNAALSIPSI